MKQWASSPLGFLSLPRTRQGEVLTVTLLIASRTQVAIFGQRVPVVRRYCNRDDTIDGALVLCHKCSFDLWPSPVSCASQGSLAGHILSLLWLLGTNSAD